MAQIVLFGAIFVGCYSFFKTRRNFNLVIEIALAFFASVAILSVGLSYYQIVMYENSILIKKPILFRFLKPKLFEYNLIRNIILSPTAYHTKLPTFRIVYNTTQGNIASYSFNCLLLDNKTINNVIEILKSHGVEVTIKE